MLAVLALSGWSQPAAESQPGSSQSTTVSATPTTSSDAAARRADQVSRGGSRPVPPSTSTADQEPRAARKVEKAGKAEKDAPRGSSKKAEDPKPKKKSEDAAKKKAEPTGNEDREEDRPQRAASVSGTRYATVSLNVRPEPDTDSDPVTVLEPGAKVKITDTVEDGFRQVVYNDKSRWVKAEYLAKKKPKPAEDEGGGPSNAPCAKGAGIEGGITDNASDVLRAICARFPQVSSYGGYRADSNSAHSSGRAIDAMISNQSVGWRIARFVRANAGELGVTEVIYSQKIWTTQRSGEGWRGMSDRGSATANHYDHVHVTVR